MLDVPLKNNPLLEIKAPGLGAVLKDEFLELPTFIFENVDYLEVKTAREFYSLVMRYPLTMSALTGTSSSEYGRIQVQLKEILKPLLGNEVPDEVYYNGFDHKPFFDKKIDLKKVLMDLGNLLVKDFGFNPAMAGNEPNTEPIKQFTDWVNRNDEVQVALINLGFNWSMPKKKGAKS